MGADSLTFPPFPPLPWEDYFWVGEVTLPSWAGFQTRRDRAIPTKSGQFSLREGSVMSESNARAELFTALRSLSEVIPEMRVGQLVAAIRELCADFHGRGLWDAADGELLEAVWQFQRNFEAAMVTPGRQEGAPGTSFGSDAPLT